MEVSEGRGLNLHIGWSPGENRTSFTAPRCPGSLFVILPVRTSQMVTFWSPPPAAILSPLVSQLALKRLRSFPARAPSYVRIRRSAGANGRMSHVRTVESCEFDNNDRLSGESCNEVTVSVWPIRVYVTACLRRSQTLMSLSIPPVNSSFPASESAIAVIGNSVGMYPTASFVRGSHICCTLSGLFRLERYAETYPNASVVRTAHKHFFAALADVHAIDYLLMAWMPPYPLSCLHIPACQLHVCRCREENFRVPRPVKIENCLFVTSQDTVVFAGSGCAPKYCI